MKKLNTFIGHDMHFGDYILFQEYRQGKFEKDQFHYEISKPILAIYLGCFVADQTIGFNYVRWNNDNHTVCHSNEYVTNYKQCQQVLGVEDHIEWDDMIDILGYWENKPNWKEILKSYRKQNTNQKISSDEIDWA